VSRDVFVQDIPEGISSVDEIPEGWIASALPFNHADVADAVRALVPDADMTDPEWMHVALPGVDVEIDATNQIPLESFALHVRASDREAADTFIARLLQRLGARAFDSASDTGIFDV
jgi:hypothetical protein